MGFEWLGNFLVLEYGKGLEIENLNRRFRNDREFLFFGRKGLLK
jgi:hypothetical protein